MLRTPTLGMFSGAGKPRFAVAYKGMLALYLADSDEPAKVLDPQLLFRLEMVASVTLVRSVSMPRPTNGAAVAGALRLKARDVHVELAFFSERQLMSWYYHLLAMTGALALDPDDTANHRQGLLSLFGCGTIARACCSQ